MSYSAGDIKWGDPVLGEPSGTVTWSADYVASLDYGASWDAGDFDAALLAAFDAWESVADIDFQMVASGGDVTIVSAPLSGAAGTAFFTYDGNSGLSEIFEGEITFNSNLTWSPYGAGGVDFYAVALHEIGHILGLGHVDDVSEIMNPVIYADDLGDGDIAGVQYLYGTGGAEPVETDPGTPSGNEAAPDTVAADDGGGGAGGAIGLIGALLALIVGLFTGGSGAAVALAAGQVPDEGEEEDSGQHDGDAADLLTDFLPAIPMDDSFGVEHFCDDDHEDEDDLVFAL